MPPVPLDMGERPRMTPMCSTSPTSGLEPKEALESAGSAAGSVGNSLWEVSGGLSGAEQALGTALSEASRRLDGLDTSSLQRVIREALSDLGSSDTSAERVEGALNQAKWGLERAVDAAREVSRDEPGRDVTGHAQTLGGNAYQTQSGFSDVSGHATSGARSLEEVARSISQALDEVRDLEREASQRPADPSPWPTPTPPASPPPAKPNPTPPVSPPPSAPPVSFPPSTPPVSFPVPGPPIGFPPVSFPPPWSMPIPGWSNPWMPYPPAWGWNPCSLPCLHPFPGLAFPYLMAAQFPGLW